MKPNNSNQSSSKQEHTIATGDIKLFTLENNKGTKLTLSNYGAAVVSLLVRDRDGQLVDIVLGYDNPLDYIQDEYYLGTVVGRYANRVSGDTVMIGGRPYKISTTDGGYHLHGGKQGFNKKIFNVVTSSRPSQSAIVFTYTSPHLEEGFPGELQLEVTYTLDDYDAWTIEYRAVSSSTTLINLTQHSYFNLSGDPRQRIDDHELQISSRQYLPVNHLQVPTGALADVRDTTFDFTVFKKIGRDITADNEQLKLSHGYDHSFVLENTHTPFLKKAAQVKNASSGIKLDVYTTEPAVHFYSGNFLNNIRGKKDIIYNKRAGFCLETQHFPDAPNHPHFPSTVLKKGEEFYSKTMFVASVV